MSGQMELGFEAKAQRTRRCASRASRAQWWFQRMRQVVDHPWDGEKALAPDAERTSGTEGRHVFIQRQV